MSSEQLDINFDPGARSEGPGPAVQKDDPHIELLIDMLRGKNWRTAKELIEAIRLKTGHTMPDRLIRALASASGGRIAGGQLGYILVTEMTASEYQHYRNWMVSQSDAMKRRVLEADKVFYAKQAVHPGSGIL